MPYVVVEKTGTAGKMVYDGVAVIFKHWTAKVTCNYADSTDSRNYDAVTGVTWGTQEPGDAHIEGMIEGYYDLSGKTANFVNDMFTGVPRVCDFYLDQAVKFCTVRVNLTDFETGVEVDGANMIAFTVNYKSSGIPTFQTAIPFNTA